MAGAGSSRVPMFLMAVLAMTGFAAGMPPQLGDGANATNICGSNHIIGTAVVSVLNLSWPGLQNVRAAVEAGDLNAACIHLASYYANSNTSNWLRLPPVKPGSGRAGGAADLIMQDIFPMHGVGITAKIPRNPDGGLDWLDKGPNDDPEFMNVLNRHDSFIELMQGWRATGNPIYTKRFNDLLIDWVTHLPCRSGVSRTGWNATGSNAACRTGTMESPWRVLECGIRMVGTWPDAFFGFQTASEFSVSARALLVLGISEHNWALAGPGKSAHTPNWEMTQWAGLAKSAVAFPELANSSAFLELALDELESLMDSEVYPDGVETEMAFGYDVATANDFLGIILLLQHAQHAPPPSSFEARVEAMWNYIIMVTDQRNYGPRNGDADLGRFWSTPAYEYFKRQDWLFVHTGGSNGTRPTAESPSLMFPWAGQAVIKSDYARNGTWAWFSVGPFGTSGHAHRAKLSMTLRAHDTMLLVDSGRFSYQGKDLSKTLHDEYSRTTHAHNTLTIDGKEQQAAPAKAATPRPNSSWAFTSSRDVVQGSMQLYDGLQGSACHSRSIAYQREPVEFFVVVDRVTTDRPRSVQATWHLHPNGSAVVGPDGSAMVAGANPATGRPTLARLHLLPASGPSFGAAWQGPKVVTGQNKSATSWWQGWYSQTYTGHSPAPTLVYDAAIDGNATWAWLLVPAASGNTTGPATATLADAGPTHATVEVVLNGVKTVLELPLEQAV